MRSIAGWHVESLKLQAAQSHVFVTDGERIAEAGPGYTLLRDGQPVACGGLVYRDKRQAIAWAMIGEEVPFLRLHRIVQRFLESQDMRIETYVAEGFRQGHRWAIVLGFVREDYQIDGIDGCTYVRYARDVQ